MCPGSENGAHHTAQPRSRKTSLPQPKKSEAAERTLRAVVDSNVWVSALLNAKGHPARVLKAFREGRFKAVLSAPLIDELVDVLSRPRIVIKYELTAEEVAAYVALIVERSNVVNLPGLLELCRDPRDDAVLETAIVGQAAYLVSRDDDLKGDDELIQEMKRRGVGVLSVANFLKRLRGLQEESAHED